MQVAHIAFTYLRLTLIYFHLECKILVKIPDSVLDSALALRRKEGDIVRENYNISNVSNLVKIKPKHANSKIKFLLWEIISTKYLQSLLTFSYVFFLEFLAK